MCKNKINDEKELKSVKLSGGNLRPTHLAILKENSTRARMKIFDYLVNCAIYLHENNVVVDKEECFSDNDNRQTFIKKKVGQYVSDRSKYHDLLLVRKKLYEELMNKSINYEDPFHTTCMDGDIDELHYNIADCEASIRNLDVSGEGLLKDISNLISNKLVWPLEAAGNDTCFLLMCKEGTVSIPLKVVGGEIWMGSLPSKSVVYLNGKKCVL